MGGRIDLTDFNTVHSGMVQCDKILGVQIAELVGILLRLGYATSSRVPHSNCDKGAQYTFTERLYRGPRAWLWDACDDANGPRCCGRPSAGLLLCARIVQMWT